MIAPTTELVALGELRPHTVVRLPDGTLARILESYVEGAVEVKALTGPVMPFNARTRVEVVAYPEQTAEAFMRSLQPHPEPTSAPAEYGIVIRWGGGFKPTDMRGPTAEAALTVFAERYPLSAPADPIAPRRTGFVARYQDQQGMQLSLGSWQAIQIDDGFYRLGPDEGPRTLTVNPLEMGG